MTRFTGGERRQNPRRATAMKAAIIFNNMPVSGCTTRNVGFGGGYIEMPVSPPPTDSIVNVSLLDDNGQPMIALEGQITYTEDRGCGVQFINMNAQDFDLLADLMFAWMSKAALRMPEESKAKPTDVPGGHTFWN